MKRRIFNEGCYGVEEGLVSRKSLGTPFLHGTSKVWGQVCIRWKSVRCQYTIIAASGPMFIDGRQTQGNQIIHSIACVCPAIITICIERDSGTPPRVRRYFRLAIMLL